MVHCIAGIYQYIYSGLRTDNFERNYPFSLIYSDITDNESG